MTNRIGDNLIHFHGNESLVRALLDFRVRFVLIGGLAVSWYCSSRAADDMDLLIEPTIENSSRLANALDSLGMTGFCSDSFSKSGKKVRLDKLHYADLLTPNGDMSFADVDADAVGANLFNMPVRIASVASLIRMKETAINACEIEESKHSLDLALLNAC